MTAQEIINRIKRGEENTNEEWMQIHKDILQFLKENPESEERKRFVPLGYLEMVSMICDGIERNM